MSPMRTQYQELNTHEEDEQAWSASAAAKRNGRVGRRASWRDYDSLRLLMSLTSSGSPSVKEWASPSSAQTVARGGFAFKRSRWANGISPSLRLWYRNM